MKNANILIVMILGFLRNSLSLTVNISSRTIAIVSVVKGDRAVTGQKPVSFQGSNCCQGHNNCQQ